GIWDGTEVGVALPFVALRVNGSRLNTYRGQTFTQATASATAIGVADLVLRVKQNAYWDGTGSLAAAADIRLPTGRERDLLGAGSRSIRLLAIGSLGNGAVS